MRYSYSKYSVVEDASMPLPEPLNPSIEEQAGGAMTVVYIYPEEALDNERKVKSMILFSNILSLF
jgi:hypothetical protein